MTLGGERLAFDPCQRARPAWVATPWCVGVKCGICPKGRLKGGEYGVEVVLPKT